jgi:hypothetical protein
VANENAGVIYAEMKLKLDDFQRSLTEVKKGFKDLEASVSSTTTGGTTQFEEFGKSAGDAITKLSKNGINQFAKLATGMSSALKALPIIGAVSLIGTAIKGVFDGVMKHLEEVYKVYTDHQVELGKMTAVLNSTGAAAWTNTRELEKHARELSSATGKTQNDIMKMQTVLLGFRSVTGTVFQDATKAIIDMAAVMGTDLVSAAQSVGKALDGPVQGMAALGRQGFVFSEETRNMIRSMEELGDHLGAQQYLLGEVTTTFEGAAEAIHKARSAQDDLTASQERLALAEGKKTGGIVEFFKGLATAVNNARAAALEAEENFKNLFRFNYEDRLKELEELFNKTPLSPERKVVMRLELDQERWQNELDKAQADLDVFTAGGRVAVEAMTDGMKQEYNRLKAIVEIRQDALNIVTDQLVAARNQAVEQQRLNEKIEAELSTLREIGDLDTAQAARTDKTTKAIEERERAIAALNKERETGLITEEALSQGLQSAWDSFSKTMIGLNVDLDRTNVTTNEAITERNRLMANGNALIKDAVAETLRLAEINKKPEKEKKPELSDEEKARAAFEKSRNETLAEFAWYEEAYAKMVEAGVISAEDGAERTNKALESEVKSLENLYSRYGITMENDAESWELLIMERQKYLAVVEAIRAKEAELEAQKREAASKDWWAEQNNTLKSIGATEEQNIEIQRRASLQALRDSDMYKEAAHERQLAMEKVINAINDKRQAELREAAAVKEAEKAERDSAEAARLEEQAWNKRAKAITEYSQKAVQAISIIVQMWADAANRQYEKEQRDIQARFAVLHKELDDEYQDKLKYAGLSDDLDVEGARKRLELAIESGDHLAVLDAENKLNELMREQELKDERTRIDNEYAEKKEELDDQMAKAEMDAKYKAAVAQWQGQLVNAAASGAAAVIQSYLNAGGYPGGLIPAGIMAGITALQIAQINANKPLRGYAEGGIVPGNNFTGDMITGRLNSGEMVINRQDQKSLWDNIKGGGDNGRDTGGGTIEIPIYLDGAILTRAVVNNVNSRRYRISQRSLGL